MRVRFPCVFDGVGGPSDCLESLVPIGVFGPEGLSVRGGGRCDHFSAGTATCVQWVWC